MADSEQPLSEGWAKPPGGASKAHYFRDSQSLCRRWTLGPGAYDPDDDDYGDECGRCLSRLDGGGVSALPADQAPRADEPDQVDPMASGVDARVMGAPVVAAIEALRQRALREEPLGSVLLPDEGV